MERRLEEDEAPLYTSSASHICWEGVPVRLGEGEPPDIASKITIRFLFDRFGFVGDTLAAGELGNGGREEVKAEEDEDTPLPGMGIDKTPESFFRCNRAAGVFVGDAERADLVGEGALLGSLGMLVWSAM